MGERLSYREREVLRLRKEGYTWEQIAWIFNVSVGRVRWVGKKAAEKESKTSG